LILWEIDARGGNVAKVLQAALSSFGRRKGLDIDSLASVTLLQPVALGFT
jgi:hypothetical protein